MTDSTPIHEPADLATVAACAAAFNGAIQALVVVLEDAGALDHGAFSASLRNYIKLAVDGTQPVSPLTLALLEELARTPRQPLN